MPSTRDSSPALAESMTTGTVMVRVSWRRARRSEKPSMRGIMTSVSTRSGGFLRASSSAFQSVGGRNHGIPARQDALDILAHVAIVVDKQDGAQGGRWSFIFAGEDAGQVFIPRIAAGDRSGRGPSVGQPAQRLLDVRRALCAWRRRMPRSAKFLRRQMLASHRNLHRESGSFAERALDLHGTAM